MPKARPTLPGPAAGTALLAGAPIVGTSGDDLLSGGSTTIFGDDAGVTATDDLLDGRKGNDTITGDGPAVLYAAAGTPRPSWPATTRQRAAPATTSSPATGTPAQRAPGATPAARYPPALAKTICAAAAATIP